MPIARMRTIVGIGLTGPSLLSGCSSAPKIYEPHISPDGLKLELGIGSCNADLRVVLVETDDEVTVSVFVENDTRDDCRDNAVVTLAEPLAERTVVDGRTGNVLDVSVAYDLGP